jgi:glycosyl hydrolase family 31
MALETVAVETFALRAISRISIRLGSRRLLLPQSYHDADRLKLENVFPAPTPGPIYSWEYQALSKVSSWETLKTQVAIGINTSLSGIPYWGTDIGGFVPTPEFTAELPW